MATPKGVLSLAVLSVCACVLVACGGAASRTERYLQRGQEYLAQGNLEKARVEYRNALQISPTSAVARYQSGLVEEKLGAYQQAAQFYQGTIDIDKNNDAARAHLARLYVLSGAAERALAIVQPGLELRPSSAELLTMRAAARAQLKQFAPAIVDAELAYKLTPNDEATVSVLAGLYNSTDRSAAAQALLESGVARVPASVDLRLVLIQFYATHSQLARAESVLLELIRLKPAQRDYRLDLAHFYASVDRVDEAERTLRAAMQALPGDATVRQALVDFLAARRGSQAAEQELLAQVSAKPDDTDLQLALARYYENGKQAGKARELYDRIVAAQARKAPALMARNRLAVLDLQGADLDGARKQLAAILEVNARDADALTTRSAIALASGDARSAIVDLRAVTRDQPNSAPLLRQLARAYYANGDRELAEDVLRQAVDRNPTDNAARADLAKYYVQTGRAQQARPLVEDLAKHEPKNVEYQQLAFESAAAFHDLTAADAAVQAIRTEHPELPLGWFLGGVLAEAQRNTDQALRDYDRALEIDGKAREPLEAMVKMLVGQKKTELALRRLARAVAATPGNAFALNLQGELLLGEKKSREADASFRAAAQAAPAWWLPYRNQAYVKLTNKDCDGALALLKSTAQKLEQPEPLVSEYAGILESMGRHDEAINAYEELLRKHPQSELGANNLAMLLVTHRNEAGSLDRARELAGRLASSSNPNYLDTNGWVLLKHGEVKAAVPVLEKAIGMAPDMAVIRYHLAVAQYGVGQKDSAVNNLERAVNARQNFDGVTDAREKLAAWKKTG